MDESPFAKVESPSLSNLSTGIIYKNAAELYPHLLLKTTFFGDEKKPRLLRIGKDIKWQEFQCSKCIDAIYYKKYSSTAKLPRFLLPPILALPYYD